MEHIARPCFSWFQVGSLGLVLFLRGPRIETQLLGGDYPTLAATTASTSKLAAPPSHNFTHLNS